MYIYPKHPAQLYRPIKTLTNRYRLTCPRVQPVPFDCDLGFKQFGLGFAIVGLLNPRTARYRLLKMELIYMCGCHIYFIFQSLSNFDHRKCLKLSLAYEYMKVIIKCKKILQRLSVSEAICIAKMSFFWPPEMYPLKFNNYFPARNFSLPIPDSLRKLREILQFHNKCRTQYWITSFRWRIRVYLCINSIV
jgi:hypothetical protein